MNKIDTNEIMQVLQQKLNMLKQQLSFEIVGIFTYGKCNYGFCETVDDITTIAYYIPKFENLCLLSDLSPSEIDGVTIMDIRLINRMIFSDKQTIVNDSLLTNYRIVNPRYEKILDKYLLNKDMFSFSDGRFELKNGFKDNIAQGIIDIIDLSLKDLDSKVDTFLSKLTDNEYTALDAIVREINNDEGCVSISQLVNKTGISRPVFNNILNKMKDCGVAEIANKGVKGMYIKLLDREIISNRD